MSLALTLASPSLSRGTHAWKRMHIAIEDQGDTAESGTDSGIESEHCERYLYLLKLLMDKGAKTTAVPGFMMSPLKHAQKRLKELDPSEYEDSWYSYRRYGRSPSHEECLEATIRILSRDTTLDLDNHWGC